MNFRLVQELTADRIVVAVACRVLRHTSIDDLSPIDYERLYIAAEEAA